MGLERHVDGLTDPEGQYGLRSLEDAAELDEDDISKVIIMLSLNVGEGKRLMREVKKLAEPDEKPITVSEGSDQQAEIEALRVELQMERERQETELERLRERQRLELEQERRRLEDDKARQIAMLEEQARLELRPQRKRAEEAAEAAVATVQTEWFKVVKSMAFIKQDCNQASDSIGLLRKGERLQVLATRAHDDRGRAWVELTACQLERSKCEATEHGRAFVLLQDRDLGNLLEGPLDFDQIDGSDDEAEKPQSQEAPQEVEEDDNLKARILMHNWEQEERRLEEAYPQMTWQAKETPPEGAVAYQALGNFVYVKRCIDPADPGITKRKPCRPGTSFFCTDAQRRGVQGGLWVEQWSEEAEDSWLLVEGPGFETQGPMLVSDGLAADLLVVEVYWSHRVSQVCLFRGLLSSHATVRDLRARFCRETQLSMKKAMLVAKPREDAEQEGFLLRHADHRLPRNTWASGDLLSDDSRTLASHGFKVQVELYLAYSSSFEADYRGGVLLKAPH